MEGIMRNFVLLISMFLISILVYAQEVPTDMQGKVMYYWAIVFGILFAISEGLSMVPAIRANGVFQFIWNILKALKK